ncbi:MAG TPA: hypothetical protein PKD61_03140 [Polyangiaceae bacterium]|nr:hypothetical protein [Polyangiaceae bacterium]
MLGRTICGLLAASALCAGCSSKSKSVASGTGGAGTAGSGAAAGSGATAGSGGTSGSGTGATGGTAGSAGALGTPEKYRSAAYAESLVEVAGKLYFTSGSPTSFLDSKVTEQSTISVGSYVDIVTGPVGRFLNIVHVNGFLYWTNQGTGTLNTGSVESYELPDGPQKSLATKVDMATGLAVVGDTAYFTRFTPAGQIRVAGGTTGLLYQNQEKPSGIAVVGSTLYWTNFGPQAGLMKGPASAGSASLVMPLDSAGAIAENGTHVFVAHAGGISRFAVAGGAPKQIATDKDIHTIRLSSKYVYWTSSTSNTVARAELDGANRVELSSNGALEPRGLAITPPAIYWTEYGAQGAIMKLVIPGGT